MRTKTIVSLAFLAALPVTAAHAYIGPGAGAGTIAVVLGILSSIFLAFVGIVWYPIKRLFRKRKVAAKSSLQPATAGSATQTDAGAAPLAGAIDADDDDDERVTQ